MAMVQAIRRNALELQFWGYETGNIVAAIAGAGGVALFFGKVRDSFLRSEGPGTAVSRIAAHHPEAAATLGVVVLVLLITPLCAAARRLQRHAIADGLNAAAAVLALSLLAFAVVAQTHLFTVAACAFVLASSLLRAAASLPVLLKLGGLMLAFGGVCLSGAALSMPLEGAGARALAALTLLSGIYVAGAGLLTCRGGAHAEASWRIPQAEAGLVGRLMRPRTGLISCFLARWLDRPVALLCRRVVEPAIFWVGAADRAGRPFYTSMMARLPWRLMAVAAGFASGTPEGAAFAVANLLWAVGDVSIGALDLPAAREHGVA